MYFKKSFLYFSLIVLLLACQSSPEDNVAQNPSDIDSQSMEDSNQEEYLDGQMPENNQGLEFYKSSEDAGAAIVLLQEKTALTLEEAKIYFALLLTEQRLEEAQQFGDDWLDKYPDDLELIYLRALTAYQLGENDKRDELIQWGLSLNQEDGDLNLLQASILVDKKSYSEANRSLSFALSEYPENFQALTLKAQVLMHLGQNNDELQEQFLWQAVETLNKLEDVQPDYVYTYVDRARVLGVLGEAGQARVDMGKAIELEPDVEWHYVDRARISLKYMNDRDSALEDLKKCEAINPDNFLALVYLAGIYFDKLDFETSLGYYERLIQIRPDYYFAYEHLGILYYTQGEFAKAKEAYLKAYDKYNAKEGYILMAALAMKQLGEAQQADALLREVARTLDSESLAHEVFRFFIEGGSDYYVLDKLHKENDDFERRKFNYYLGEYYLYTESAASALNCFTEASELDLQYEGRIAQWHIQ